MGDGMDAQKPLVLVAEDSAVTQRLFTESLERAGYRVVSCETASAAFAQLEGHREVPEVLLDLNLPDQNGMVVLRELIEPLKEICQRHPDAMRIALSGHAKVDTMLDAVSVGTVYRFVMKPWANEELKQVISQALEYYNLPRDHQLLRRVVRQRADVLQRIATEHPELITVPLTADGVCALSGEKASILRELMRRCAPWQAEVS